MKHTKFATAFLALAIACHTAPVESDGVDPPADESDGADLGGFDGLDGSELGDGGSDGFDPEPSDPPRGPNPLLEPGLVPAEWPADLYSVDTHPTDHGDTIVVGRNQAGKLIARIELAQEGSDAMISVRAWWHDGHAWAVADVEYGVIQSANFDGVTEAAVLERLEAMSKIATGQAIADPMGPQAGPRLDCAISVIKAVFRCLPWGGLVECPTGIIEAVCTCSDAAAKLKPGKRRKRPRPAVCDG